ADRADSMVLLPGVDQLVEQARHLAVVRANRFVGVEQPAVEIADDRVARSQREQDAPAADERLVIAGERGWEVADDLAGDRLLAASPLEHRRRAERDHLLLRRPEAREGVAQSGLSSEAYSHGHRLRHRPRAGLQ